MGDSNIKHCRLKPQEKDLKQFLKTREVVNSRFPQWIALGTSPTFYGFEAVPSYCRNGALSSVRDWEGMWSFRLLQQRQL